MRNIRLAVIPLALAAAPVFAQQQPAPRDPPFLGIITELKKPGDETSGVVVAYTWPLSPARQMGIQIGDEIRAFNDVLISTPEGFSDLARKENVNAKVRFQVRRAGQDMKIEGRVGNRDKVMKAYQDMVRQDLAGKPLPPLPAAVWWNAATKTWDEKPDGLAALKGKLSIVMSFDDCEQCREKRYKMLSRTQAALASAAPSVELGFAGIFYDERPGKGGKEASLKTATALVTSLPPSVPIAVAFYPKDAPSPAERDAQVLIQNHGCAIIDSSGNVSYIQIVGTPENDFGAALQQALLKSAGKPDGAGAPTDSKGDPQKADAKKAG